jgi:NSS family neurotransmitter:Na+ symporter
MIAYASYLPKRSDITNNAFITSLANCGYSFFAGFAVFSTLGFLALQNSERLQDVVRSGITLAFVTYPTAIGKMPGGVITQAVLAIIFFITLFTLGIDSLFSIVEAVVTGFRDKFKIKREKVVTFLCIISFIFGLLYCTKAGLLWLDIVDHWMSAFGLACVGLFQCILIGWLFGTPKIREHINQVSDFKIGKWWDFCIKFLTPLILIITIGMSIKEEFSKLYGGYPLSAIIIGGWSMAVLVVVAGIILGKVKRAKTT